MPKVGKQKTSKKNKASVSNSFGLRIRKRISTIHIVLFVVVIGLIGGYLVTKSRASSKGLGVVSVAASQIGQREWSSRVLEYSGNSKDDWCAYFVSWVYWKSGYTLTGSNTNYRVPLVYKQVAGVPNLRDTFKFYGKYKTKETGYTPKPGDVVIFARSGRSHTGIVESTSYSAQKGLSLHTIEGNTSTNDVARRVYSINDATIDGYGVF